MKHGFTQRTVGGRRNDVEFVDVSRSPPEHDWSLSIAMHNSAGDDGDMKTRYRVRPRVRSRHHLDMTDGRWHRSVSLWSNHRQVANVTVNVGYRIESFDISYDIKRVFLPSIPSHPRVSYVRSAERKLPCIKYRNRIGKFVYRYQISILNTKRDTFPIW